jgi:HlyD family secretion protein
LKKTAVPAVIALFVVAIIFFNAFQKSEAGAIKASGSLKYKRQAFVIAPGIDIEGMNSGIEQIISGKKQNKPRLSSLRLMKPLGTVTFIGKLGRDVTSGERVIVISNPEMDAIVKKAKAVLNLARANSFLISSKKEDAASAAVKLGSASNKIDLALVEMKIKLLDLNRNIAELEMAVKRITTMKERLAQLVRWRLRYKKVAFPRSIFGLHPKRVVSHKRSDAGNLMIMTRLAKLKAIRATLLTQIQKLNSLKKSIKTAKRKVRSGMEKLDTAQIFGNLQITLAELNLGLVEFEITKLTILSPISGFVTGQEVQAGELVYPGQKLLEIADTKNFELTVYLPLDEARMVKAGDKISITADSFPGKKFRGIVSIVSPVAEFAPTNMGTDRPEILRVRETKAEFEDKTRILKDGMQVDAFLYNKKT